MRRTPALVVFMIYRFRSRDATISSTELFWDEKENLLHFLEKLKQELSKKTFAENALSGDLSQTWHGFCRRATSHFDIVEEMI